MNPALRAKTGHSRTALGHLGELARVVTEHRIDLLLIATGVPRLHVLDHAIACSAKLDVRVQEMTAFYEAVFRRVPVAELNAAWFQYVLHPRFAPEASRSKRALDIVVALAMLVVLLPVLLVIALLIKLDGGPVLYRQTRIGERGEPFTIYKLRTMRTVADAPPQWAVAEDPRVTRVGAFLRRLHIDELPQVYNVLRGEMSMVGPRPEQPELVERLAETLPFYSPRHLVKPGLTGWAQIRCGYAGSESGSVWKLCHDLYYIKHRSLAFDVAILARTITTVIRERDAHAPLKDAPFVTQPSGAEIAAVGPLELFDSHTGRRFGGAASTRHHSPVAPEIAVAGSAGNAAGGG